MMGIFENKYILILFNIIFDEPFFDTWYLERPVYIVI